MYELKRREKGRGREEDERYRGKEDIEPKVERIRRKGRRKQRREWGRVEEKAVKDGR